MNPCYIYVEPLLFMIFKKYIFFFPYFCHNICCRCARSAWTNSARVPVFTFNMIPTRYSYLDLRNAFGDTHWILYFLYSKLIFCWFRIQPFGFGSPFGRLVLRVIIVVYQRLCNVFGLSICLSVCLWLVINLRIFLADCSEGGRRCGRDKHQRTKEGIQYRISSILTLVFMGFFLPLFFFILFTLFFLNFLIFAW